jgi:hypothetical protein
MDNVEFIQYKGRSILKLDISNSNVDDSIKLIENYHEIVIKQPENSLLTLMVVSNARFDTRLAQKLKVDSVKNKPFIKASAIVGLGGLQTIIFNTIKFISGRDFKTFDNIDKALEWLINH